MNWLQELCTAEEYCVKCDTSYSPGFLHSCGETPIKPRATGKLKVIDIATGRPAVPILKAGETFERYDGVPREFVRWDEKTRKNIFRNISKAARRKERKKAADYFAAHEFGVEL